MSKAIRFIDEAVRSLDSAMRLRYGVGVDATKEPARRVVRVTMSQLYKQQVLEKHFHIEVPTGRFGKGAAGSIERTLKHQATMGLKEFRHIRGAL